jgi:AmmeMemoRadiSam system protein B
MYHADPSYRPRVRPGLRAEPHGADDFVLHDPLRIGNPVVLSPLALELAQRFDGEQTPAEIVTGLAAAFPQLRVTAEQVAGLAEALDGAMLLDSPRFRERVSGPVRKPSCVGSYSGDPVTLREQLTALFTAPGGPGLPHTTPAGAAEAGRGKANGEPGTNGRRLRAILAPHMDYARGNTTYGHAFKELVENTDAATFVIVATSHYSTHRFTLTRQHFETPLGLVETDQEYVNRIAGHYGGGLFDDVTAHLPEHSIELEVVLLRFLLTDRRPFKIVPLLTGSIQDCVWSGINPGEADDIARMVTALRAAEAACAGPVCYVISGDLAHIGPKFGDNQKAAGPWLDESRAKDTSILNSLETASPRAFFDVIAAEQNARRICGLSPAWLTLEAVRPAAGRVLHYQQFVHPQGHESVSFAAAAFYG